MDDAHGTARLDRVTRLVRSLDAPSTQAMFGLQRRLDAGPEDVLLAAFTRAVADWARHDTIAIDVCRHGRGGIGDGADLSRTVGWMTTVAPYVLVVRDDLDADDLLGDVAGQCRVLRAIEVAWGPLRYRFTGSPDPRFAELPPAQLYLNYRGVDMGSVPLASPFGPAPESTGVSQTKRGDQPYEIKLWADVIDGRLTLTWIYSTARFRNATVSGLADGVVTWINRFLRSE